MNRQDWASCFSNHVMRRRAENESAQGALSLDSHDDQLNAFILRNLQNLTIGRVEPAEGTVRFLASR